MSYLKDSQALRSRRDGFILSMQRGAMPAMCKMKLWAELKNAIIYEAFRQAGLEPVAEAFEPFGFRKPTTVLAELKERYEDWDAGRLPDDGFRVYLDRLRDEFDMLVGLGKVTDAEDDSFEDEYSSSLYAVSDVPDLTA